MNIDEKRSAREAQEQLDESQKQVLLEKGSLININKMGNNCCAQDHHCKFQVEKHNILINNTMVKVVHGELVKENVDAIVNSANSKLAHCGGIALAIGNAAGGEM